MMGDTQQPRLSSPSTDDMAQTPMSVMKRRGEGKKWKEFEGERTGTPLRWPPTESSCSWRVYPHHYILARSHAARHSRIMSCFKKRKRIIPFFLFLHPSLTCVWSCGVRTVNMQLGTACSLIQIFQLIIISVIHWNRRYSHLLWLAVLCPGLLFFIYLFF